MIESNPFLEEAKLKLKSRNKFLYKEKDKENKLLSESTGAVTDIQKTVYTQELYDPQIFVKVYIHNFEKILELSKAGLMVLNFIIYNCLQKDKSYFYLSSRECEEWYKLKDIEYNARNIRNGIKNLVDSQFIIQSDLSSVKYFLNVNILHNGQIHKMNE